MSATHTLIASAYAAFNDRNIDSAFSLMSEAVSWPKASEGGRAVGKEEIRAYWTRQWQEFNPHVEPVEMIDREPGLTEVRVHQVVKNLGGELLFDGEVWHVYTTRDGLIERMDLRESVDEDGTSSSGAPPTAAFARHERATSRGRPASQAVDRASAEVPLNWRLLHDSRDYLPTNAERRDAACLTRTACGGAEPAGGT